MPTSSTSTNGGGGAAGETGDSGGSGGDGAGGSSNASSSTTNGSGGTATAAGGTDSSSSSTGNEGGGAGDPGDGGASSSSGGSGGNPMDCPDLDRNAVADCEETLVLNAGFESDANGWAEETDVLVDWDGADAMNSGVSGSISVSNTALVEGRDVPTIRGVQQCIPASGGARYVFLTQLRIDASESQGWGGINVWFHDEPGCTGEHTSTLTPLLGTTVDWSYTQVIAEAPASARSMLVRLVVSKWFSAPPFAVEFDNVLVREE